MDYFIYVSIWIGTLTEPEALFEQTSYIDHIYQNWVLLFISIRFSVIAKLDDTFSLEEKKVQLILMAILALMVSQIAVPKGKKKLR